MDGTWLLRRTYISVYISSLISNLYYTGRLGSRNARFIAQTSVGLITTTFRAVFSDFSLQDSLVVKVLKHDSPRFESRVVWFVLILSGSATCSKF